jgi:hypothetical protein
MKKNIALVLLLATGFSQIKSNDSVLVRSCFGFGPEVAQPIDIKSITGETFFSLPLDFYTNLAKVKEIEEKLARKNINIFKLRIDGFSVLQLTILRYDSAWYDEYKKKAEEVFNYLLSKISAECLNEFVEGSYTGGIYYGTAVAVAALRSSVYFKKIVHHPQFNPTNFLTARSCGPTCTMTDECMSVTPQRCLKLLSWRRRSSIDAELLIYAIRDAFPSEPWNFEETGI